VRLLAVRMPWQEGPCAIALARFPLRLRPSAGMAVGGPVLVIGAVLVIVLAVAGPIVSRIRRLTAEVSRSAAAGYATGVEVYGKDEIADLGRAFNAAAAEVRGQMAALEQRDKTLRSFVANTTHDVAIPLTVLQGHLASVRRQLDLGEAVDRMAVGEAIEEAHYLGSLLHNLAAAAKLESTERPIERHPVDLNRVVERAVARHRPIAAQKKIALDFAVPETPLFVLGDLTLIEQAVSNVVLNAVHHNTREGHVGVLLDRVTPTHREPVATFCLRVLDDGPGVPDAEIPHLIERGYRGNAPGGRQSAGHGLGLHIAHYVMERHGFRLQIRRAGERGLLVEFAGPLLPEEQNGAPAS